MKWITSIYFTIILDHLILKLYMKFVISGVNSLYYLLGTNLVGGGEPGEGGLSQELLGQHQYWERQYCPKQGYTK